MTFSYDPTTDVGRCRRTLPDRVEASAVFTDEEWASFLADEGDWRRATALALETVASDTAATLRVTETLGLRVDGAKASDALLKRAAELRKQAAAAVASDEAPFDVAELVYDEFTYRERLGAELLRSAP